MGTSAGRDGNARSGEGKTKGRSGRERQCNARVQVGRGMLLLLSIRPFSFRYVVFLPIPFHSLPSLPLPPFPIQSLTFRLLPALPFRSIPSPFPSSLPPFLSTPFPLVFSSHSLKPFYYSLAFLTFLSLPSFLLPLSRSFPCPSILYSSSPHPLPFHSLPVHSIHFLCASIPFRTCQHP